MNRSYKSIWNEATGTFVAVAENVNTKGKRSSSVRKGGILAAVGALTLSATAAMAAVEIDDNGNTINFTGSSGSINFGAGGSIVGLSDLTISGVLSADQIMVGGESVATLTQLNATSADVQTNTGKIDGLEARVTDNETAITSHDTRITDNETAITAHDTRISDNETVIADHGSRIGTAEAGLVKINDRLATLGVDDTNPGVKYFRANSTKADAQATGLDSVAIGPQAVSSGANSLAAGLSAKATGVNSVATGNQAIAAGKNSVATGNKAKTDGENSVAVGNEALAKGKSNIALGDAAKVDNDLITDATAIGSGAEATGSSAVALGHGAKAGAAGTAIGKSATAAGSAIAMGTDAKALAGNSLAFGNGAQAATSGSIAIGARAGQGTIETNPTPGGDETHHIALGVNAGQNIKGNQSTSIGYGAGSGSVGDYGVAIGNLAGQNLQGNNNVTLGHDANKRAAVTTVQQAVSLGAESNADSLATAVGDRANATGVGSVALGQQAATTGGSGVALGFNATSAGASVALGANSNAVATNGVGFITNSNAAQANINVVSVGNSTAQRRITNVADGSALTDAVTVNQLKGAQTNLADILGGGTLDANGNVQTFKVGTQTFSSVAEAFNTLGAGGTGTIINDAGAVIYNPGSNKAVVTLEGDDGTTIKNLADGVAERDAVNVGQMDKAIEAGKIKYFSVNSTVAGNQKNDGATAANAIAIGPDASATAESSVALGNKAITANAAQNSVAVGSSVVAHKQNSVVVGNNSNVYDASGIAIGDEAESKGLNSIVMGTRASSDSKLPGQSTDNAIVIGTDADVTAKNGIALGQEAVSSEKNGMAFGKEAEARGVNATATGTNAIASGENSMASGFYSRASGVDSVATGTRSAASGPQSQALGFQAKTYATDGIALGSNSVSGIQDTTTDPSLQAFNNNTIAIGNSAQATFQNATATGTGAKASAESASASGTGALASAKDATASGTGAKATAENASASGTGAAATAKNTIANGTGAQANAAGAIAFGLNAGVQGGANVGVNSISTGTGAAAQGLDSIASGTGSRAYTNGSVALGRNAQAGQGPSQPGTSALALGDGSGAFANNSVALGAGSKTNNSYGQSTAAFTGTKNADGTHGVVSVGDAGAERRILNVAGGQNATDAVNVSQLTKVNDDLILKGMDFAGNDGQAIHKNLGQQMNIVGGMTAGDSSAANIRTVKNAAGDLEIQLSKNLTDLDSVTIGSDSSNQTIIKKGDITTNKITSGQIIVNNPEGGAPIDVGETLNKGITFSGDSGTPTEQKLGGALKVVGDSNINTTATNGQLQVELNKNLNLGGTGSVQMGNALVNSNGLTITNGPKFTNTGISAGNQQINNVLAGTAIDDAVNLGQLNTGIAKSQTEVRKGTNVNSVALTADPVDGHSIYTVNADGASVSKGSDAVTVTGTKNTTTNVTDYAVDLSAGTKTSLDLADSALQSFKTQINGVDVKTIDKDNGEVNFIVGNNMALTDENGSINIATAMDVNFDKITINNGGPILSGSGIDMNDKQIIGVAAGTKIDHAVNLGQLNDVEAIASAGWNLGTSNTTGLTRSNVAPNAEVDFVSSDDNVVIKHTRDAAGNTSIDYKLSDDVKLGGDLTVIGETKLGNNFVVNKDGAYYTGPITDGNHITNKTYVDGKGTELTELGMQFAGNEGGNVHRNLGEILMISGGATTTGTYSSGNLKTVTNPTTGAIELQMAEAPKFGDITINEDGRITGVEKGIDGRDAVNVDQLGEVADIASAGWNIGTSDTTALNRSNVAPNAEVDFVSSDDNVVIEHTRDANGNTSIDYKLSDDVKLGGDLTVIGVTKLGNSFEVNNGGAYYTGPITDGNHITNKTYVDGMGEDLTNAGLGFLSNRGDAHKKLGEVMTIRGNMDDMSGTAASGKNIRTIVNKDGEMVIQMSKNLTNLETVTVGDDPDDQTIINKGSITTNSVTTTELNAGNGTLVVNQGNFTVGENTKIDMGGNKVTNIAEGTDTTDAVNFGQLDKGLKAAKTEVEGEGNIEVTSVEKTPDGQTLYTVKTKDDVNFNSVTSADAAGNSTVLNKDGVAAVDEDDNEATYTAAGMDVKDADGNTTKVAAKGITIAGDDDLVQPTELTSNQIIVGGNNPIVMNGNSGMITGLTNQNWSSSSFADGSGRAATEEQLKPLGDFLGFKDGNYTFNYNGEDHKNLASALNSIHWNVEAPDAGGNTAGNTGGGTGGNSGSNNSGSDTTSKTPIANTNTVGFKGDSNLTVSKTERVDSNGKVIGADIQYTLNKDIKVDSITALKNVTTNEVTINNGPVINQNGIDMRDKQITNVADGVAPKDAVNVSQLENVKNDLHTEIGGVRRDLHKVDRKLRAGIAAAMATAALPQAYLPGKSMVGIGGGTWNGESGVALGVSTITDNGKWVFKFSGNASTRGDYGGTVGAGYQW